MVRPGKIQGIRATEKRCRPDQVPGDQRGQDHCYDVHPRCPKEKRLGGHGLQVRQHPDGGVSTDPRNRDFHSAPLTKPTGWLQQVHALALTCI